LNKIWPWKEVERFIEVDGVQKPLVENNVLPSLANPEHFFWWALLLSAFGMGLILAIELVWNKKKV